jgi:hypothetical protein
MFTLPVGWRPPTGAGNLRWLVPYSSSTIGVYINQATGDLRLWYGAVANMNIDLSVIGFDTESVTAMPTGPKGDTGATGATGGNATVPMDTWHVIGAAGEPAFANSWVNDAGATTKFRKYPDGKVRIAGRIRAGTLPGIAFTLPVGYRPTQLNIFDALCNNGSTDLQGQLRIDTVGAVTITGGSGTNWFTLDGIEFDTESVTQVITGPVGPKGDTGGNATVPMGAWHTVGAAGEPAFGAGFSAIETVAFRIDPLGVVHLRGDMTSPAGGGAAFTLPVGYRPPRNYYRWRVQVDGPTVGDGRCYIGTNGVVQVDNSSVSGANAWALDPVEFDTETVTAMPTGPTGQLRPPYASAAFKKDPLGKVQHAGRSRTARVRMWCSPCRPATDHRPPSRSRR